VKEPRGFFQDVAHNVPSMGSEPLIEINFKMCPHLNVISVRATLTLDSQYLTQ